VGGRLGVGEGDQRVGVGLLAKGKAHAIATMINSKGAHRANV
jgi:hypothetical protein